MCGHSILFARIAAGTALCAAGVVAQAATILAGSGANPPATATGIYEIAVVKTDAKVVQSALALVHDGRLQEIHSRSSRGYQRRISGSATVRVSASTFSQLLTLAGGVNRNVDFLPLAARCQFYALAKLPTPGMNCPTMNGLPALPAPETPPQMQCPDGYELEIATVNSFLILRCVQSATTSSLLPSLPGRYVAPLFGRSISFAYLNGKTTDTPNGAWVFEGLGFTIGWLNDGP